MASTNSAVVVARTSDGIQAQLWVDMLRDEGLDASTYTQGVQGALGGASGVGVHLVLVHRDHVGDARNIIAEAGGASAIAPIPGDSDGSVRMVRVLLGAAGVALAFMLILVVAQAAG